MFEQKFISSIFKMGRIFDDFGDVFCDKEFKTYFKYD